MNESKVREGSWMSESHLVLMGMAILAGAATVYAQHTPRRRHHPIHLRHSSRRHNSLPINRNANPQVANPQSSNRQSSTQEVSAEELPGRKPKEKGYNNWSFNVGGGGSLTNGETTKFVRGGGGGRGGRSGSQRQQIFWIAFRLSVWTTCPYVLRRWTRRKR